MRRGFILTLLTLVLFMILVQMAVQLRTERSRVSSWTQSMMVDRKMLYTTDDIAEEAKYIYGVRLERTGTRLAFYDTMPANYSIDRSLRGYRDFLLQKYLTADMSLQFYDRNRTAIDLTALDPSLITYPYNLTYRYGNNNKTVLSVYCAPSGPCRGADIESAELNYRFGSANFTWMPVAGNISHYNWNPRSLGNCTGDPKCINFTLKLTDAAGYT